MSESSKDLEVSAESQSEQSVSLVPQDELEALADGPLVAPLCGQTQQVSGQCGWLVCGHTVRADQNHRPGLLVLLPLLMVEILLEPGTKVRSTTSRLL